MEKSQFNVCMNVLTKLQDAGVLQSILVVGSWCIYFYQYYFESDSYNATIRTRDIDFLVPLPAKINKAVKVTRLLEDLGFVVHFYGSQGYIKLEHPDLIVEFLVPERGRGTHKPYKIRQLGINAQPLRYLDFLSANTIAINVCDVQLVVPHPAAFALHKFIIFKRRKKPDKKGRDLEGALRVIGELLRANQAGAIKRIFSTMPKKWRDTVIRNLASVREDELVALLQK